MPPVRYYQVDAVGDRDNSPTDGLSNLAVWADSLSRHAFPRRSGIPVFTESHFWSTLSPSRGRGISMAQNTPADIVRHASTWSIAWGVLLIIFGMLAIGSPFLAAVAVSVVVGWLIILAGAVHVVLAFHAHGAGSLIWKLLVGIAYLLFGAYLLVHPLLGVASLTLVLASLFLIEGILDIVLFFKMRSTQGSTWVLIDGIITLLLGLLIYLQWPSSSIWAVGTLVGVSMIISGITRVMLSFAARKATATA